MVGCRSCGSPGVRTLAKLLLSGQILSTALDIRRLKCLQLQGFARQWSNYQKVFGGPYGERARAYNGGLGAETELRGQAPRGTPRNSSTVARDTDQGLGPWTPPDPRYRLTLRRGTIHPGVWLPRRRWHRPTPPWCGHHASFPIKTSSVRVVVDSIIATVSTH